MKLRFKPAIDKWRGDWWCVYRGSYFYATPASIRKWFRRVLK